MTDHAASGRGPWETPPGGLGLVLDAGRGSLPYALVHGEALVACAAWALGAAQVTPIDAGVEWAVLVDSGEPVVLHDSLCPLVPPAFIASCVERALATGAAVLGVRPVTDTVKTVSDGLVGETVDRDSLLAVASPLVLPPAVVASLADWPGSDLGVVAGRLAASGHRVETVEVPPEGRRVTTPDDVTLLEALTAADGPGAPRPA